MSEREQAPEHGARFRFELIEAQDAQARYRVVITTPEAVWMSEATLGASTVRVGAYDGPANEWAQRSAVAFLDVVARGYDAEIGWPRLVHRWREPRG